MAAMDYSVRVPAEHVLAMRRQHEVERRPVKWVIHEWSQYSADYVRKVLDYQVRAKLRLGM